MVLKKCFCSRTRKWDLRELVESTNRQDGGGGEWGKNQEMGEAWRPHIPDNGGRAVRPLACLPDWVGRSL